MEGRESDKQAGAGKGGWLSTLSSQRLRCVILGEGRLDAGCSALPLLPQLPHCRLLPPGIGPAVEAYERRTQRQRTGGVGGWQVAGGGVVELRQLYRRVAQACSRRDSTLACLAMQHGVPGTQPSPAQRLPYRLHLSPPHPSQSHAPAHTGMSYTASEDAVQLVSHSRRSS